MFLMFSQPPPMISQYSLHRLPYLTKTRCSLRITNWRRLVLVLNLAVSHQPFIVEARLPSRNSPRETLWHVIHRVHRFSSLRITPPTLHSYSHVNTAVVKGQTGEAWEPTNKALLFVMIPSIAGQKGSFHVVVWSSDVYYSLILTSRYLMLLTILYLLQIISGFKCHASVMQQQIVTVVANIAAQSSVCGCVY